MRLVRRHQHFLMRTALPGSVLLAFAGCLGPNPGFFISTSVANATIFTLVNTLLQNLLGGGGSG